MKEEILHYLWQHQVFDLSHLQTVAQQQIRILSVGIHNENAGPDFSLARLFIDDLEWYGSVEIHVKSSDWNHHKHQQDPAYDRVILHVVWQYDQEIYRADGTSVPTLELKSKVDATVLIKIEALFNAPRHSLACAPHVKQISDLTKTSQIERAAAQRLERKAEEIIALAKDNGGDWEETSYQWLLRGFGFQINSESMLQLAKAFPLRWVRKHCNDPITLRHLLVTQAGLSNYLENNHSDVIYPQELDSKKMNDSIWRYSRMRPANFPHIRIAQIAGLMHDWKANVRWLFSPVTPEEYTERLYIRSKTFTPLGKKSVENLIINVLIPLMAAYGIYHKDETNQLHAWQWLEGLSPENNRITRIFKELGFNPESALDSQGMVEQYQKFCEQKKCLKCSIGASVMKKHPMFVS